MLSDSQTVGYQFLLDISIYFVHRCAMNIPNVSTKRHLTGMFYMQQIQ